MFENIEPYIGQRVLEVGAGIGNITQYLIDREFVLASDIEDQYLTILLQKFGSRSNFKAMKLDFMDDVASKIQPLKIDTIICLNVLEHIYDDRKALKSMFDILVPGGNVVLLVPAHRWLYGSLDVNLLHHRRYSKKDLVHKFQEARLSIRRTKWMNIAGIAGWFINSRILKTHSLSAAQLTLYEKLVPFFRLFEKITGPPVGQSIIVVGNKSR